MLTLLLASAAAIAAPQDRQAGTGTDADSKPICKSSPITGSRVGTRRICKSKAEWQAEKAQAERSLEGIRDRQVRDNSSTSI